MKIKKNITKNNSDIVAESVAKALGNETLGSGTNYLEVSRRFIVDPLAKEFENVTTIEAEAFKGLTFQDGFVFPNTIKFISPVAFSGAIFEGKITWPKNITFLNHSLMKNTYGKPFYGSFFKKYEGAPSFDNLKYFYDFPFWNSDVLTMDDAERSNYVFPIHKFPESLEFINTSDFFEHWDLLKEKGLVNDDLINSAKNTKLQVFDRKWPKLPEHFILPETTRYLSADFLVNTDFSALPDGKIGISRNVQLPPIDRLPKSNYEDRITYTTNWEKDYVSSEEADEFLSNPNLDKFKDLNSINPYIFMNKRIPKGFVFPDNIVNFYQKSFAGAELEEDIVFPKGANFSTGAFDNITFLGEKITFPSEVTEMNAWYDGGFIFKKTDPSSPFDISKYTDSEGLVKFPDSLENTSFFNLLGV